MPYNWGCHQYEVDRFTMKLMILMSYRYANRCVEDHTRLRNALFSPARSFLKKLLMAFLPSQLRAIYICVYFDQLYVRARSKMAAPIRPARKHCFFIKITISQNHHIDISYIDIDFGKNAFSMTTLPTMHVDT